MKMTIAIAMLCIPGLLAARETCTRTHTDRGEVVRVKDAGQTLAWPRSILFEPQIL